MKNIVENLQQVLKKGNFESFRNNRLSILLIFSTVISMILGSIHASCINLGTAKKLDILFLSDFDVRTSQSIFYTFVSSFCSNFLFWLTISLSAFSIFGVILSPLILIFRQCGLGFTAGYLYLIYGFKGLAFYILVLMPGMLISSASFIFLTMNSVKFSIKVIRLFCPNLNQGSICNHTKIYIKKLFILLFILLGSSVIDMGFMKIFYNLFVF